MELEELKNLLNGSWSEETCSPGLRSEWSLDNPSLGQCAVTALIVNDFYGGKIMRCMTPSGSHYYNELDDGRRVDLTVNQFLGEIPRYEEGQERTRDYLLGNKDTKSRYLMLWKNLKYTCDVVAATYEMASSHDENSVAEEAGRIFSGFYDKYKKFCDGAVSSCKTGSLYKKRVKVKESETMFKDLSRTFKGSYDKYAKFYMDDKGRIRQREGH